MIVSHETERLHLWQHKILRYTPPEHVYLDYCLPDSRHRLFDDPQARLARLAGLHSGGTGRGSERGPGVPARWSWAANWRASGASRDGPVVEEGFEKVRGRCSTLWQMNDFSQAGEAC